MAEVETKQKPPPPSLVLEVKAVVPKPVTSVAVALPPLGELLPPTVWPGEESLQDCWPRSQARLWMQRRKAVSTGKVHGSFREKWQTEATLWAGWLRLEAPHRLYM